MANPHRAARPDPEATMSFSQFLIGTLLVSSLILLGLLVAPRVLEDAGAKRLPLVCAALAVLLLALGFLGGLSAAG